MTQDILQQQELTPTQMKQLGKRVVYLMYDDFRGTALYGGQEVRNRVQAKAKELEAQGGVVYTGHHSETDWDKLRYWQKGWHLFNRTGDYAVVMPLEGGN